MPRERPASRPSSIRTSRRRRSLWPTARGGVTLVAGVVLVAVAYQGTWPEVLVAGCAGVLLTAFGTVFSHLSRPRLEVIRAFTPLVVEARSPVRVSLAVRNLGVRPTQPGLWNDALPWFEPAEPQPLPSLASAVPARELASLTRRERSAVFRYDLHPERRGIYPVGPLAVEIGDPFGMARQVSAQGETDDLVVVPAVTELPGGALSLARAEGSAMLVQRRASGNDDDLTTREYRRGDALRRVHWRASARHDELMVRQEEQRSYPEARVLLDSRRDGYPDADTDESRYADVVRVESETFEWAIELFASVAQHLVGQGFAVRVDDSAERSQVEPFGDRGEGGRHDEAFLTSLARIRLVPPILRDRVPPVSDSGTGPVFAVLGAPSDLTLGWVRKHRRPGEVAVAFLGGEGTGPAAAALRDAGWIVVEAETGAHPLDVWAGAHERWGELRGAR